MTTLAASRLLAPRALVTALRRAPSALPRTFAAAPAPAPSPAPSPAPAPAPAAAPAPAPSDRLHSTDIAFKPTEDGWGYNKRYADSWDRIFARGNSGSSEPAASSEPAPTDRDSTDPVAGDEALMRLRDTILALEPDRRRRLLACVST